MKVKYYEYEGGQSIVHLPKSIARALGLEHKSLLNAEIKALDGKAGVFLSIFGRSNLDPEIALGTEPVETPKKDVMAVRDYLERNFTFEEIRAIAKLPSQSPEQIVAKAIVQAATEAGIKTEESEKTPEIGESSEVETEQSVEGESKPVALDWEDFVQRMKDADEFNKYGGEIPFYEVFTSPEEERLTMPNLFAWEEDRKVDLSIANDPDKVNYPEFLFPIKRGQLYFVSIRKSIWEKLFGSDDGKEKDEDEDDEE